MNGNQGSIMKLVVFFGLFLLSLAFAIYVPNLNSPLLGINLTNVESNLLIVFKAAFVVIGLGFLIGALEQA